MISVDWHRNYWICKVIASLHYPQLNQACYHGIPISNRPDFVFWYSYLFPILHQHLHRYQVWIHASFIKYLGMRSGKSRDPLAIHAISLWSVFCQRYSLWSEYATWLWRSCCPGLGPPLTINSLHPGVQNLDIHQNLIVLYHGKQNLFVMYHKYQSLSVTMCIKIKTFCTLPT